MLIKPVPLKPAKRSATRAPGTLAKLATVPSDPVAMRDAARSLYWQGWRISSIAKHLKIKRSTVASWKERDKWHLSTAIDRVEGQIEARMVQLVGKEVKTGSDFKEIDLLTRSLVQMSRKRRYDGGGNEADLNPNLDKRNAGPKKKPTRNDFSEEQQSQLLDAFRDSLFDYQKVWYRNGHERTRIILKSRQIGATWYFAREALADALATGRNQIFLSASKAHGEELNETSTPESRRTKRIQQYCWNASGEKHICAWLLDDVWTARGYLYGLRRSIFCCLTRHERTSAISDFRTTWRDPSL